jgi:hypothetical protein
MYEGRGAAGARRAHGGARAAGRAGGPETYHSKGEKGARTTSFVSLANTANYAALRRAHATHVFIDHKAMFSSVLSSC